MKTMKRRYLMGIVMMLAMIGFTSCDDFLDITPTGKVIANTRISRKTVDSPPCEATR